MTEKEAREIASKAWPDVVFSEKILEMNDKFVLSKKIESKDHDYMTRTTPSLGLCYLVFKADGSANRGTPLTGLGDEI